jgi:(2S)-methylsuccinyl-CoA dehydrogenase
MTLTGSGNTQAARTRLVELMQERSAEITVGNTGLDDELEMIREQFRRYSVDRVIPEAHEWHLKDELIPMEVIEELAEMGVFGLTIPEEFGGFGCRRRPWCVVSEELSPRLYRCRLARHPVGDRGGTDPLRRHAMSRSRSGCRRSPAARSCPPPSSPSRTPAPTSASLRTRAVKDGDDYKVTGNKTWITHPRAPT